MPKKKDKSDREDSKRLCSELFAFATKFLDIKAPAIVDNGGSKDVNTVSSWRTRGYPRGLDLETLIQVLEDIIEAKRLSFGAILPVREWKTGILDVLEFFCIKNATDIVDDIVNESSLSESLGNLLRYADRNRAIYEAKIETAKPTPIIERSSAAAKYERLVIFDLDGTLIKGIKYSWTLLYQAVRNDASLCKINKKKFEEGLISYPEWCDEDLRELQEGGLTWEIAQEATKRNCSLTRNFYEAIKLLKNNGFAVAIISGGADAVLNALIPDAYELFDNNIFINKLIFDDSGQLVNIEPTPYDWDDEGKVRGVQGKNAGLKMLCDKYNIPFDSKRRVYGNCAFVGDDDNDFKAMRLSGIKIFYHAHDKSDVTLGTGARDIPKGLKIIVENDLMKVAKCILESYKLI